MSMAAITTARSPRRQALALLIYAGAVAGLAALSATIVSNLLGAYAALGESQEVLAHLERISQRGSSTGPAGSQEHDGPPFLTGKTITVAGAALQERVSAIATKAGANVLSSQIDLTGPRASEGFVGLSESVEINQEALQPLLYDLEAGMPYLFVDNLSIQSPQAFGEAEGARMRVTIGVTGQWRDTQ
jgi:general secretion pathway protein M